jgi:hypothetical protein
MMQRAVMAALLVLTWVCLPARGAPDDTKQETKAQAKKTPKEQFQAVLDEYQNAQNGFSQAYSKAKTPEERSKVIGEKYPKQSEYADRFMAIADAAPNDPAAVDCLVWCLQLGRGSDSAAKAINRLAEKHADSPKLASAVPGLAYSYAPTTETLLRAVIEKNKDRTARGNATMALAQYLNRKIEIVRAFKENAKRRGEYEQFLSGQGYDKAAIDQLAKADADAILAEVESLFDKVVKDFGDINSGRGTLGKLAGNELNEIRNLGIGKPSPEISGSDIDGKSFKLSDYKGNVVVVDFWGDW